MKKVTIKNVLLVVFLTILLIFLFINISWVWKVLGTVVRVFAPILYGLVIAYILNYPYKLFYNRVFPKMGQKNKKLLGLRKALSLVISYIIIFGIVALILTLLVPQLGESIKNLIDNVPAYAQTITGWLDSSINFLDANFGLKLNEADVYNKIITMLTGNNATSAITNVASWAFPWALNTVTTVGLGVYNWIIGIIVSIYLIAEKDKLLFGARKIIVATFPRKASIKTLKICNFANNKCGRFLIGKIIDSAIIGVICFIFMSIFRFDYALLISVIVGVTNVIPFFGPFIGAIPSAFLLLIINPIECFWFIVFIIGLQIFDGYVLGPKILGESVGISGFWILFSVLIGGGLFGFPGMLLGVPVFAVIYSLIEDAVNLKLKKKALASIDKKEVSATKVDKEIVESIEQDKKLTYEQEEQIRMNTTEEDEKKLIDEIDEEAKAKRSYYSQF